MIHPSVCLKYVSLSHNKGKKDLFYFILMISYLFQVHHLINSNECMDYLTHTLVGMDLIPMKQVILLLFCI